VKRVKKLAVDSNCLTYLVEATTPGYDPRGDRSKELITQDGNLSKNFALRDQLRRAALSIPTNIAEGFERSSRKEYLNFLNFAKGSAGELRSLLLVASEIGCLDTAKHTELRNFILELSRYLSNHIKSLRKLSP
jgi:four helix bundle protein